MPNPLMARARHALFNPYPDVDTELILRQQKNMRRWIGILGILLPILLWATLIWATAFTRPLESISHYYYTRVGSIMVLTISLICFFLMIYKGKALIDRILTTTAAVGGFLVVLFPTDNLSNHLNGAPEEIAVTCLKDMDLRVNLHFASAGLFILSLALMSVLVFTQTVKGKLMNPRKKLRNRIYYVCGAVMILAILTIAFQDKIFGPSVQGFTFAGETIAIWAFGFAWFVKGETIFRDLESDQTRGAGPGVRGDISASITMTEKVWADLNVPEEKLEQLREIITHCKQSPRQSYFVIFEGPFGYKKTLAATLLGRELGSEVYRIDLGSLSSKYIGETEKNIEQLFSLAEKKEWILFFDEADALFGQRTNVKDAHDKYANQEVSFLLQRMKNFKGLIILASNIRQDADHRYVRKLDATIDLS